MTDGNVYCQEWQRDTSSRAEPDPRALLEGTITMISRAYGAGELCQGCLAENQGQEQVLELMEPPSTPNLDRTRIKTRLTNEEAADGEEGLMP
mmetsp:Transcript_29437/g.54634  ORF Transcript_29437/g.54634 Transcript_29437/m.54634 type:complete len:93 (+) Transcript_29437:1085-1363(+)